MTKLDSFLDEVEEISEYGPVINREAETAFINYMRNTVPEVRDLQQWGLNFHEANELVIHLNLKLENDKLNNCLIWGGGCAEIPSSFVNLVTKDEVDLYNDQRHNFSPHLDK